MIPKTVRPKTVRPKTVKARKPISESYYETITPVYISAEYLSIAIGDTEEL